MDSDHSKRKYLCAESLYLRKNYQNTPRQQAKRQPQPNSIRSIPDQMQPAPQPLQWTA